MYICTYTEQYSKVLTVHLTAKRKVFKDVRVSVCVREGINHSKGTLTES